MNCLNHSERIRYPIGIQTFEEIRKDGYVYVDKTSFIHDLAVSGKYFFLSRPRRFGKSLLMSTLESYFKGDKELFEGLQIFRLESDWIEYPVMRFDLSGGVFECVQQLQRHIDSYLTEIGERYGIHTDGDTSVRFRELIRKVYELTGRKVVILVDEYDKPMLDSLHDDARLEAIKDTLRGFYSVIKASDQYIRFAMLTGITKFGKVSVFSGLNNLKDISMLPRYNAICGISESEFHRNFAPSVTMFAHKNGISEAEVWERFRKMYDGYRFAAEGEGIYNPFSMLNAFFDGMLDSYWYESGSPSYLIKLVERYSYRLDHLEGERRSKIALNDISDVSRDFVPLLYQSGYLTIKGYDKEMDEYILGFPNKEVRKAFWRSLADHFFQGPGGVSAFNLREFTRDLISGNAEGFMNRMRALFSDTSSEPERNKEIHFQNMMAIVSKMLGLTVKTEVHSSMGRCDMQIITDRFIYIFEFKIDGTAEEALAQIHEKQYHSSFSADSRNVILIGANFDTKTRTLGKWIIERLCGRTS